ncbi:MAG: hypothetical protein M1837_005011 [Sclerophora amabilis]|nr:MAG: hypothetical protein M1837_005011 [Sclerophora amabilis]
MQDNPRVPKHIVVIGAGIIGLQSAVFLLQAGYKVTVVAKYLPGDLSIEYTSPWDSPTHPELLPNGPSFLWWRSLVSSFTLLPPDSLPPKTATGICFTSYTANPEIYLRYLQTQLVVLGGRLQRLDLSVSDGLGAALTAVAANRQITSAGARVPVAFVNATGLSARTLVPDGQVYPSRGQTVLVRGVAESIRTRVGEFGIAYVIPRGPIGNDGDAEGTTVLGGCKQAGNWSEQIDDTITRTILDRCKTLAPELLNEEGEFDVLGAQVGLRPAREGGARVEMEEIIEGGNGERFLVVHSYGHGGAG